MRILDSSQDAAAVRRPFAKAAVVVAAAALLAGCGGGGGATASGPATPSHSAASIAISDFKFLPPTLTVRRGARIAVTNSDGAPHTVTADDGHSFESGTVPPAGSATLTVGQTGRFPYHCSIHPFMTGELVVR